MKRKVIQHSLNLNHLFEEPAAQKQKRSKRKIRFEHAEVRRLEPSISAVESVRMDRFKNSEPRRICHEWMLWLLKCGLIDRSHWPVSHSGLYTDFT